MPTLPRARPARPVQPEPPRWAPPGYRAPGEDHVAPAAVAGRPRWWPTRRRPRRVPATSSTPVFGRVSRATVLIALAALAAALGAAGIAVAAWLSSGAGRPGVSAGNALAPTASTVAGSAVTSGLLVPGATGTGTAIVTVTNPDPDEVRLPTIAADGAATAAGGTGTCATTGVSFTTQQPGVTLAAGAGTTPTLAGAVAMSTASETGGQGATFIVPVTVTVASTL